mgnify:CR=1 FL=1
MGPPNGVIRCRELLPDGTTLLVIADATRLFHENLTGAKDKRYVQIAAGGDGVFQRLAAAIDMPELATDPRYATSRERIARALNTGW